MPAARESYPTAADSTFRCIEVLSAIEQASLSVGAPAQGVVNHVLRGMGDDAAWLLPSQYERHRSTFMHGARTGALALLAARCGGTDEIMTRELVLAALQHDAGKYHHTLLPLVCHSGVFSDHQRRKMATHAPIGGGMFEELAMRSRGAAHFDADRAELYFRIAQPIVDHHAYDLIIPRSSDDYTVWQTVMTKTIQLVDRVDAITSSPSERAYLRRRMHREGECDPRIIASRYMREFAAPSAPLPLLGVSPREVVELALHARGVANV
jgi:hypothetical protein